MRSETHNLFYSSGIVQDRAVFSAEECHHMLTVLRAGNSSDIIHATDGKGNIIKCSLATLDKKSNSACIIETVKQQPVMPKVHMYIGLPEREAFEEAIANLTAMGVNSIIPVVSRYCQQKWWNGWNNQLDRFSRKMVSALKQSMNVWLPVLEHPIPFSSVLANWSMSRRTFHIVADSSGNSCTVIMKNLHKIDEIHCMVGPPGGFSPDESKSLSLADSTFVSLGKTRLRQNLLPLFYAVLCFNHISVKVNMNLYSEAS